MEAKNQNSMIRTEDIKILDKQIILETLADT